MASDTGRPAAAERGWKLPTTRAALLVLKQEGGGPLHYRAITEKIESQDLITTSSEQVERVVYSSMSKHIRKSRRDSWFRHAGPGMYALTKAGREAEVWRHSPEHEVDFETPADVSDDLTWPEAAEQVLRDTGEPMHYREITKEIWRRGLKPKRDQRYPYRQMGNRLAQRVRKGDGSISRSEKGVYVWSGKP